MRKFILKLIYYIVILIILTLGINTYYLLRIGTESEIDNVPTSIEICNFGSSHGFYGFNYEDAKGKFVCFNFALHSQSLLYDYRILQHYKDRIKNGAVVFITISYFSFFGFPETESDSFLSRNRRYYKFLPSELILAYDWKTNIYINYLPALSPTGLKKILKSILGTKSEKKQYWERKTNQSDSEADASKAFGRHIAKQHDKKGIRMLREESFQSLYDMIKLCREIGAKPILITVPYTQEYTNVIKKNDPEFFSDFYSVIEKIKHNSGIEYYDYAFDERFCRDYNLFINSDHLNREGARKFTDILLREVLGIEVLPPK